VIDRRREGFIMRNQHPRSMKKKPLALISSGFQEGSMELEIIFNGNCISQRNASDDVVT
jgi:hypothetical protein